MLHVADDLSSFTLAAGEPFLLDLRLLAADGRAEPLTGRAFVLSFHEDDRQSLAAVAGELRTEADGAVIRFAREGYLSEALFGHPLTVELAERFRAGRDVIATGRLIVTNSAAALASLPDGPAGRRSTLVTIRTAADGNRAFALATRSFAGDATPTPTPISLTALTLPADDLVVGTAAVLAIGGASAQSTITGTMPPGLVLDGAARSIAGKPAAAGRHAVTLVETLAGAANSPRSTEITIVVAAQPTVSLSASQAQAEGDGGGRAFTYTVTRSSTRGAVAVAWTFAAGQTTAGDFVGDLPTGGVVTLADGVATAQFAVIAAGDGTVEPDESFTVALVPPPGYAGGASISATGTILNDDVAALAGFAANGATNAVFRAAVARVRAGTGRGRIVWLGDSTAVGQGGGTGAPFFLGGARAIRGPAVVAALLTAGGTPALDGSTVADNAVNSATGQLLLEAYDPRIAQVAPGAENWTIQPAMALAGGGYWQPGLNRLTFTPAVPADTFEIVAYRSSDDTYRIAVGDAPPVTGPAEFTTAAGGGFVRHRVTAAGLARHTLSLTGTTRRGALQSITAYDSAVPALDIVVHAALGALSAHQAATGSGWSNREALTFAAPDLTIVCLGLNDMNAAVGAGTYAANLRAIVDAARLSGDVLLLFPPPAGGSYNNGVVAYRDAAAGVAADRGVAFFSLYDHYGAFSAAIADHMVDGQVHPRAEFQAEVAGLIHQALRRMAPAIG